MLALFATLALATATPAPLVAAPVQPVADEDDDERGTPEGCLHKFLCYELPDTHTAAATWIGDDQLQYLLIHDVALFAAGRVNLPFAPFWMPFALYYLLVPSDERPELGGDLLTGMLILAAGSYLIGLGLIPLVILPFGLLLYLGLYLTWEYWITPVTQLHLYNTALKEQRADEKRKKKKKKRRVDEDDDDE